MSAAPPDPAGLGRVVESPAAPGPAEPAVTQPGDPAEQGARRRRSGALSFLAELPILVLVALAVAVLIKTFLVQAFYIPSGSMIPTLEINDRVLVNKLAYRLGDPQRGDIVVFESPFNGELPEESLVEAALRHVAEAVGLRTAAADDFIKRVVAVEGDAVEVRNNQVLVNGEPLEEPYVPPGSTMPDEPEITVRPGHVFVMGDNREHSQDSRIFGDIPAEDIVGRAFVRIWPPQRWDDV